MENTQSNSMIKSSAKNTWDNMDIHKVRDVSWSSLETVKQQIGKDFKKEDLVEGLRNSICDAKDERYRNTLKGAALICGDMESEKYFFCRKQQSSFVEVDGYDISEISLSRASQSEYLFNKHVIDCNNIILPRKRYNLIVASNGIHHVYNLYNLFFQSNTSLADDDSLFYMYEWIGPKYLQIPFTNKILSCLLLYLLFPNKRLRTTHLQKIKGIEFIQYNKDSFDPSEACNSEEILENYYEFFDPIYEKLHGGLLYPIFEGIAQNFDEKNNLIVLKIKIIIFLENILTKVKLVKPLFVLTYGKRKSLPKFI